MSIDLSPEEHAKLARLRRTKLVATSVLIVCLAIFVGARWLSHAFPDWSAPLGYLAAFAEAATIGGLADWYAVVVLFRHPLGVKLPHTAIIPANQERIADNLGEFLERNFLTDQIIRQKLGEIDYAAYIVRWLGDRDRSDQMARFAMKLIPDVLDAIEESGFKDFAAHRIAEQVQKTEFAPVATRLIDSFVKDGRYEAILDEIIEALDKILHDEDTLKSIEKKVAEELPTVLYVLQAESVILKRIVKASGSILSEVKKDPDHPLRAEFRELFEGYVERMKTSKRFARRVERFKQEILERPEIASLADRIWDGLADYVERDTKSKKPVLARQLSGMLVGLAKQLQQDEALCRDINGALVKALSGVVSEQKSQVSRFVADEVKGWDFKRLVTLIEANVGRDLQFIRFNGMIIGGIAGLLLHAFDVSILP